MKRRLHRLLTTSTLALAVPALMFGLTRCDPAAGWPTGQVDFIRYSRPYAINGQHNLCVGTNCRYQVPREKSGQCYAWRPVTRYIDPVASWRCN